MVDVNLHKKADKEAVEIVVEPYPSPVNYKGEYHYRSGSTKQELKGAAILLFHPDPERFVTALSSKLVFLKVIYCPHLKMRALS